MTNCVHLNIVTEEVDGVPQDICNDCGDILNFNVGLKFDYEAEGERCDELYVPPIQRQEYTKHSDPVTKLYYKKQKIRSNIIDILNKLNIEIIESIVEKTAQTYINFLSFNRKTQNRSAIILECFIFNGGTQFAIPCIDTICNRLNIPKKSITRGKKNFKDFCIERNFQNTSNTNCTINRIRNNKNVIVSKIKEFSGKLNDNQDVGKLAIRLTNALDNCHMLSFHNNDETAHAILHYVRSIHKNNFLQNYKPDIKTTTCVFRNRISKINSIIL
ncbi:hypothetical protein MXB_2400, partial [Myxobolus squamalis]